MTLTDPPRPVAEDLVEVTDDGQQVEAPARVPRSRRRWRQLNWRFAIATGLAIVLGLALLVAIFEGPVAREWEQSRQHHLASDFTIGRPGIAPGQAFAVLQGPKVGLNVMVGEGDDVEQLRAGPGHRIGTPKPGQKGNVVILGHRRGWGAPFASLAAVRTGQLLVLGDRLEREYVYRVTAVKRVSADDTKLLAHSTDHRLTLVTSAGGNLSDGRLVVTAVSGKVGRLLRAGQGPATTQRGSRWFNRYSLYALLATLFGVLAYFGLRRRYHRAVLVATLVPLVTLAVLCVLLNLDRLLAPPLR